MNKANNAVSNQLSMSWETMYGIDGGALTNATRKNFIVNVVTHADFPDGSIADITYFGTGALTTSEYANLPQGSRIWCPCLTAPAVYLKTARKGTATFKYTAINT